MFASARRQPALPTSGFVTMVVVQFGGKARGDARWLTAHHSGAENVGAKGNTIYDIITVGLQ